jgi:hypothetical protein
MSGPVQGLAPYERCADIGGRLHGKRDKQPAGPCRSHQFGHLLQRAEMQHDQNDSQKAHQSYDPEHE